jgi:RNA polymerase sigma-70 factor (ECF subfamily)
VDESDRQRRFDELYRTNQVHLRAFVLAVTRDNHRCDDILQEVSLVLWRRLDDFDASRSFLPWARGVAANCILKESERRRRAPPALSPEALACVADATTLAEPDPSDRQQALRRCLDALGERGRQLLTLRYERALGIEELARVAGTTIAAVKKGLYRTRARLVDCMRERLGRAERG